MFPDCWLSLAILHSVVTQPYGPAVSVSLTCSAKQEAHQFTLSDCTRPSKDKTNQECYYFISKFRSTKDTSPAIASPSVTAVLVVIAAVVSVTATHHAIGHLNTRAGWVELSHLRNPLFSCESNSRTS